MHPDGRLASPVKPKMKTALRQNSRAVQRGDVDPIDRPNDDMSMDALDAADADDDAAVLSRPD